MVGAASSRCRCTTFRMPMNAIDSSSASRAGVYHLLLCADTCCVVQVHPGAHALPSSRVRSPGTPQHRLCSLQDAGVGYNRLPSCGDWRRSGGRRDVPCEEEAQAGGPPGEDLQAHCLHRGHVQLGDGGRQVRGSHSAHRQRHPRANKEGSAWCTRHTACHV